MGFTRIGGDVGRNNPEMPADDADNPIGLDRLSGDNADHDIADFTARVAARHTPQVQHATAKLGFGTGHHFWRSLTRSLDGVIKSNSIAHVIPPQRQLRRKY